MSLQVPKHAYSAPQIFAMHDQGHSPGALSRVSYGRGAVAVIVGIGGSEKDGHLGYESESGAFLTVGIRVAILSWTLTRVSCLNHAPLLSSAGLCNVPNEPCLLRI
jgi:hypothetical protein